MQPGYTIPKFGETPKEITN